MALNMETGKLADVASLDHVNILTNDVEACRQFYIDVLGFEEGFRPDFGFPGLWIYLGGAPVVHFIQTKKKQPLNSGTIDHIAFRAHNYEKFAARLKANKVKFNDQSVPGMDLHQIFCFDPHGIKVEFNFEGPRVRARGDCQGVRIYVNVAYVYVASPPRGAPCAQAAQTSAQAAPAHTAANAS